jgi:hypothetical protein
MRREKARVDVVKMEAMVRAPYVRCAMPVCLLLAGFLACAARADTIILKNGRKIVAAAVTRENGKVTCETSAGVLSFPESMVAEIRKDGVQGGAAEPDPKIGVVQIAPPSRERPEVSHGAASIVHDGAIDEQALARLDAAAAGGSADDRVRAAVAESEAGHFEFDQGHLEEAFAHAERAAELGPTQVSFLLDLAYLHLQRSEDAAALEVLERAGRLAPDSPDVAKLTGWADYALNRLPQAVAEWKRAQQIHADPEVANALEKAERDLAAESDFREGQSAHFDLRYYGGAAPELSRAILQLLEADFQEEASVLDYTPQEPIGVVLYTNQAFSDITRAPSWVGALNDGRIRVPVQGLEAVTPELARVLRHELAHSFITQKTRGRSPTWVQEGVAQWIDGSLSSNSAAMLVSLYDSHQDPSLSALEGGWMDHDNEFAGVAYAWSLAVVEAIVAAGGPGDVDRLLDKITTEPSTEAAARAALHMDYADLNQATAEYLRRTYLH